MPIPDNLINQRLAGCSSPDDILGESGLLTQLTKRLAERASKLKWPPISGTHRPLPGS